jgi:hypothetical protein
MRLCSICFKRVATRANDLWLEEENGKLLLKAADTSSLAVLRRLSRGMFGRRRAPDCINSRTNDLRSDDSVFVFPGETTKHYRLRYRSVTVRTVRDADLLNSS